MRWLLRLCSIATMVNKLVDRVNIVVLVKSHSIHVSVMLFFIRSVEIYNFNVAWSWFWLWLWFRLWLWLRLWSWLRCWLWFRLGLRFL